MDIYRKLERNKVCDVYNALPSALVNKMLIYYNPG